jgi:Sulfotransferase domain
MSSRDLPLPTFLIIGAQKSATRWLRFNLGLHPDVFAAATELAFFNNGERFRAFDVLGYRAQFQGWSGEPIVGEATPGYMMWRHHPCVVAERIEQVVPGVRLIAILRNPVDRAQSAMVHHMHSENLPPGSDLLDLVRQTPPERDPLGLVAGGWYAASLQPYKERFGDQLLVLVHDDAVDDPRGLYERALRHIGATADFFPADLEQVRFSRQQQPTNQANARRMLSLEKRRELYEYFRADVRQLEQMLGRDLSAWNPGRAGASTT